MIENAKRRLEYLYELHSVEREKENNINVLARIEEQIRILEMVLLALTWDK